MQKFQDMDITEVKRKLPLIDYNPFQFLPSYKEWGFP